MASLSELCTINAELSFAPIGAVRQGMRLDVPFEGTATSPHWEGERKVKGVDYITVGADGSMDLNIRGQIKAGREVIGYQAIGRNAGDGPMELLTFDTAIEEFAHLNNAIAVAIGTADGTSLTLEVFTVDR